MKDLFIKDGDVYINDGFVTASIVINDGLVEEMLEGESKRNESEFLQVINAKGKWILPGLIDAHVHFNDPGREEWEGFITGSYAAAAGGITTVFDMPLNSSPSAVTAHFLQKKKDHLQSRSLIDYGLWAGITETNVNQFDELKRMKEKGIIGFKAFLSNSGISDFPAIKKHQLKQAMVAVKKLDSILALHAEDQEMIEEKTIMLEKDRLEYLKSRPLEAEDIAIKHALEIAEETEAAVHFVHVSSPKAIQLIFQAKQKGVDVSVEICPHYLLFTDEEFIEHGPILKCAPPLRSAETVEGLWDCLAKGLVDTIGSDHSPCPIEMKTIGNVDVWKAWGGIQGVQFAFPYLLGAAVKRGLAMNQLIPLMTSHLLSRFKLEAIKGTLEVGGRADLTIYHPNVRNKVSKSDILTKNRYSPYEWIETNGEIQATVVRGKLVFEKDQEVKKSLFGYGIEIS